MKKLFLYLIISIALITLQVKPLQAEIDQNQYKLIHSPYPSFPRKANKPIFLNRQISRNSSDFHGT